MFAMTRKLLYYIFVLKMSLVSKTGPAGRPLVSEESAASNEQRRQVGLSISRQTTAIFVNRQKGSQRSWRRSRCTSGPTRYPETAVM